MDPKSLKDLDNQIIQQTYYSEKNEDKNQQDFLQKGTGVVSSSSSSIYSTAEEDFETPTEDESDVFKTLEEPIITATKTWVTGTQNNENDSNNELAQSKSCNISNLQSISHIKNSNTIIHRKKLSHTNINISAGSPNRVTNNVSDASPGPSRLVKPGVSVVSSDDEEFRSLDSLFTEGRPITVHELQAVFDCFKSNQLSSEECERLIDLLGVSQSRNDFQWALHQLGGFNALLFLYARVVEICEDDEIQSKGLSLVLGQIKNHSKSTDVQPKIQYNLIRFVLNSEKSSFGFKSFQILLHHCLTPSGNKLLDYELLESTLLSTFGVLIKVRCTEAEAPTGRRSLFECLMTVLLDLLLEKNVHRALNIASLKAHKFADTLLSICYNLIFDSSNDLIGPGGKPVSSLSTMDALRISALVRSIFSELMAPPDAYVAIAIINYGLYPLLPKELPPLPSKEDAFFVFQNRNPTSPNAAADAEEIFEDQNQQQIFKRLRTNNETSLENVDMLNEDIPEIVGRVLNNNQKVYNKETFGRSQYDGFRDTFQESLIEALMAVLLNTLSILPDGAFFSVLRPHMSSHLLVSYCSHPKVSVKILALKLLSTYLSRVKNPCVTEFLKSKGFFLTSLFIQSIPETSNVVTNICQGFGPVSYPLVVGLLQSNSILTTVLQWVQDDESSIIPALLSMGLIPAIMNIHRASTTAMLPRPLNTLISHIIRFCVLNSKDDPWKLLFCPALESAPHGSHLTGRFYQESVEFLKAYRGKELKKGDANTRILWLLERSSASRFGINFDKWLLSIFTLHIMECMEEDETDGWKYFVKKHRKRMNYLMGVFLCKVFAPNKGDFEFKQHTLRALLQTCPNVKTWLPKVLRSDDSIERCFTAFLRIFLSDSNQRECPKNEDGAIRRPSLQSLISEGSGLLSLQMSSILSNQQDSNLANAIDNASHQDDDEMYPGQIQYSNKTIRDKFEDILVDSGILSPTNNFSTFSTDFKNFKILLEAPPICGVSYHELRQCLVVLEKLRAGLNKSLNVPFGMINTNDSGTKVHTKGNFSSAVYFEIVFESVMKFAVEVLDCVTRIRTKQEIDMVKKLSTREDDIYARSKWWALAEQMSHPKAPWHFPEAYPKFWALDQSEGPGRVRVRLGKEHLKLNNRFVLPKYRTSEGPPQPLEYLFQTDSEEFMTLPSIKSEIQFMRFCTRIIPGEEIAGEIILSADTLYFIPEASKSTLQRFENVEVPLVSLIHILRRRYTLEDRAAEIFVGSQSFLFVFRNQKDREEFVGLITIKHSSNALNSSLMDSSITSMTAQWNKGQLSNFEYLMYLNTAAGRTYCDLMQYPVFPFVLAKYDSPTLDLHAPQSYRDLKKPMAIQDPSKEEHFLATYNYLKRECDSAPFHYGSHYSNSGIVLHFLIRLPPYTQHFLTYQDGSFDIPDRSFHSLETTWRLASRESNTDFKEAIPEFYYLPEFLQNLQHFDFGVRQNGKRVDDVALPEWAKGDPRLFTLINRQALESNQVRRFLSDWVDLIFGYKQTGKPAIQAINVFHPSTYEGFEVEGVKDELLRRARKAMVSTYGQTPKKLFPYPHLRSTTSSAESCEMEVLDTVWGIRWGNFLGSPTHSELEVVNTRIYVDSMALFESPTRIVFWPDNTLIMGDNVVGSWSASKIQIKSHVVYICIGDEITICVTTESSIWVGHQSGRITVLKLSRNLDKVIETLELVGHYKPIKDIDLNSQFSTAITCSGEDYALVWDMNRIAFINVIQRKSSVDSVYSSRSTGDVALVSHSANTVTLTTINGFEIGTVQPDEKVESACLSSLDPGRNVNLLAVGCDYGYIRFYSTWDLKFINEIKVVPLASLPIHSIRYSKDGRRLYCLSRNEETSVSVALQLPESSK